MGLLEMLSPVSIGSTALEKPHKPSTGSQQHHFKDRLQQAQCEQQSSQQQTGLLGSMVSIGVGAATSNPIMTGNASLNVLQNMMGQELNQQFGFLGNEIGMQFFDALAGKDSSTQLLPELPQKIAPLSEVITEPKQATSKAVSSEDSSSQLSSADFKKLNKLEFRKGTLPWQVEQQRLKDILEARTAQKS